MARRGSSVVTPPRGALHEMAEHADDAAALLKALANEQRLLVLCSLLPGPLSVGGINERVRLSQSALSQHLAVLRAAGIVTTRREAQTVYYALAPGPSMSIMGVLHSTFCAPRPVAAAGQGRPRSRTAVRG